jgi:hypothetical protein
MQWRFIQGLSCRPIIQPSHKISPWSSLASPMEILRKIGRENRKANELGFQGLATILSPLGLYGGHRVPRTKPTCLLHTWRPHRRRPFTLVLHLHQHQSSRNLHLQYLAKNQSTQRCQSLITQGSDHPPVLEPHVVLTHQSDQCSSPIILIPTGETSLVLQRFSLRSCGSTEEPMVLWWTTTPGKPSL